MKNSQIVIKPQDIVILLKIISLQGHSWKSLDLAHDLYVSPSEVSESLRRCVYAGLLDSSKKMVYRRALLDLLLFGIKYVFPQKPGPMTRGIPTAHSAPPLSTLIHSVKDTYVWEEKDGDVRGEAIIPLYPTVPKAVKKDASLYEFLALVDAIRVGKSREHRIASDQLKKRILDNEQQ